jgi:hypothetical protein
MTWRPERRNASMPKRAPAAVVEELLAQLGHFRDVLGNRRSGRPSWGAFLQGIRVEKTTRQGSFAGTAYRALHFKMVELRGLEPLTPRLPGRKTTKKSE